MWSSSRWQFLSCVWTAGETFSTSPPPSSPPPPPTYPLQEILTIGRCMHQMFIASNLFFVWRSILVAWPDMNKQQWRGEACVSMCWQDQIYFNKGRRIGGQLAQLDEIERWDKQGALVQLYDVASLILGKLNRQTLWTGLGGREKVESAQTLKREKVWRPWKRRRRGCRPPRPFLRECQTWKRSW